MQEVFRTIGRLSRSVISVLITGESGTGKELVARTIHQLSPRAEAPMIDVNCAAIPETLAPIAESAGFEEVTNIVLGRCSMCHAEEPVWDGILWAPKGVKLETEYQITRHAKAIYLQAGVSHAMPPANLSYISDEERASIVAWYLAATQS